MDNPALSNFVWFCPKLTRKQCDFHTFPLDITACSAMQKHKPVEVKESKSVIPFHFSQSVDEICLQLSGISQKLVIRSSRWIGFQRSSSCWAVSTGWQQQYLKRSNVAEVLGDGWRFSACDSWQSCLLNTDWYVCISKSDLQQQNNVQSDWWWWIGWCVMCFFKFLIQQQPLYNIPQHWQIQNLDTNIWHGRLVCASSEDLLIKR